MRRILLATAALSVLFAVFSPAASAEDVMPPGDSAAAVDQSQGRWYLGNDDGSANSFYFGDPGDYPLFGDWNGNSEDTPGVYRQSDGRVYLRNTNDQGVADSWFYFGNPDDVPISGDFNGSGMDSISVFRPTTSQFFIINTLGANGGGLGAAEFSFSFGNQGDMPLSGDWNGDGVDGIGVYRPSTGEFLLRNDLSSGEADQSFTFGNIGDKPVVGDWDGDGTDEVGVQRGDTWYFQGAGSAVFGEAAWFPVAGFFMSKIGTGRLDIVETARAADDFNVLLAALEATELDAALKGPGPFTVFAPTDQAFADLEAANPGIIDALLADEEALTRILTYHAAAGKVPALDVVALDGSYVETLGGELVWIDLKDGEVFLNGDTQVVATDIYASNGVIHVIDTVLVPQDIVETAVADDDFNLLVAAVGAAGLGDALSASNGPYTLFAPTDGAFEALPKGTLEYLLDPVNIEELQRILTYHVAEGVVPESTVATLDGKYAETLGSELVWIDIVDGKVRLNNTSVDGSDAEVLLTDIKTSNGIIHVIDAVLVPQDIVTTAAGIEHFSTLVYAIGEAGLGGALSVPNGPYTVFAPTNAAFDAVDDDLLDTVLSDPTGLLTGVLTYHVLGDVYLSSDVAGWVGGNSPATLQGSTIAVGEGFVLNPGVNHLGINNAQIVLDGGIDIKTSNGVIHVIDAVIVPPLG
jgi:transforming growth factor-beta-induced protein